MLKTQEEGEGVSRAEAGENGSREAYARTRHVIENYKLLLGGQKDVGHTYKRCRNRYQKTAVITQKAAFVGRVSRQPVKGTQPKLD